MEVRLGELTPQQFLHDYWQKKPLLIRQAFPDFVCPLDANELAGLACEREVRSRMILERGGRKAWELRHGPFQEEDFEQLSDSYWTLLVQEVDRHVPEVADLMDAFAFLPEWRKDDVMISFASHSGGVGPHTDSYDVFLLQGSGRRRWEIAPAGSATKRVDGLDLQVLADFKAEQKWDLEPGDMLYLPPGVPHNGVALEPCLTLSFGFLAPTRAELMMDLAAYLEEQGSQRYRDPDLTVPHHGGALDQVALDRVRNFLGLTSWGDPQLADWFGRFVTRLPRPDLSAPSEGVPDDFDEVFAGPLPLRRSETARWAFYEGTLFVNGEAFAAKPDWCRCFCGQRLFEEKAPLASEKELLETLYQRDWIYFAEDPA